MTEKEKKDSFKTEIITGATIVLFVIIAWLISWYYIDNKIVSSNLNIQTNEAARGVFGDKFGAVNALFSGLAFCGIIITILLQRRDLEIQREELKYTRRELERSALAQEKSEESLREQSKLMEEQARLMKEQANTMKEASKLNAINTIVTYYSQAAAASQKTNWDWHIEATSKATKYIKQLENQMEEINKKDNGK